MVDILHVYRVGDEAVENVKGRGCSELYDALCVLPTKARLACIKSHEKCVEHVMSSNDSLLSCRHCPCEETQFSHPRPRIQSDNFHCGVGGMTIEYSEQVEARNSSEIAYKGRKENGQE
jgi:hypothetical protein